MNKNFKSGFVSIIGRPNVGKSTLVNNFVHNKVSIISPKAQTTRNRIQGIYTTDNEQIIFIDTPGIHKPRHKLGEFMNNESIKTLTDCDLILLVIDGNEAYGTGDEYVINLLNKLVKNNELETKVYLVINKIDLVKDKNKLMENVLSFTSRYEFNEVYYISALKNENIDALLQGIISNLDNGPMYYPKDQISDHPESFVIAEIIREKVLTLTHEEVPHSVGVIIENMETDSKNSNLVNINACIVCERASQKKIIIGKAGEMIKKIGTLARKDIVMLLGRKVFLDIWVKVEEDWRDRQSQLKELGYFNEE